MIGTLSLFHLNLVWWSIAIMSIKRTPTESGVSIHLSAIEFSGDFSLSLQPSPFTTMAHRVKNIALCFRAQPNYRFRLLYRKSMILNDIRSGLLFVFYFFYFFCSQLQTFNPKYGSKETTCSVGINELSAERECASIVIITRQ